MPIEKQIFNVNKEVLIEFIEANENHVRPNLVLQFEKILIDACMELYGNNQTRIAEVLGVNRGTLRTRMKALNILPE